MHLQAAGLFKKIHFGLYNVSIAEQEQQQRRAEGSPTCTDVTDDRWTQKDSRINLYF